jgi:hypothetical protein
MHETDAATDATLIESSDTKTGPGWLVRPAPGPDLPHDRDRAGAQRGLAIALLGGGLFWGVVAAGLAYLLRR